MSEPRSGKKLSSLDRAAAAFLSPAQADDEIGRLGPYRVLKVLGKGGMGMVFKAEDVQLQRMVAIKIMLPEIAKRQVAKDRFLREARAAAKLEHDHIISIFQVGEDRNIPFIAMPFLKGMSLDDWLKHKPPLGIPQILRIGRETAKGLQTAHEHGLIHRDIKPANLWLDSGAKGRVKILDFGLARPEKEDTGLTKSGQIIGTPAFMSPEQAAGQKVDARSDLFSLGVVLYRLCAGRLPFQGDNVIAIITALALEEPKPVTDLNREVPPALADLIHRLLAKKPDERPASAKAVVDALTAIERERMLQKLGNAPTQATMSPAADAKVAASQAFNFEESAESFISDDDFATAHKNKEPDAVDVPNRPRWFWPAIFGGMAALAFGLTVTIALMVLPSRTPVAEEKGTVELSADGHQGLVVIEQEGKPVVKLRPDSRVAKLKPGRYTAKPSPETAINYRAEPAEFDVERDGPPSSVKLVRILPDNVRPIDPSKDPPRKDPVKPPIKPVDPAGPSIIPVGVRPPLSAAPFNEAEAKAHQEAWAKFLGMSAEQTNSIDMKLRLIPPGKFLMGSPDDEKDRGPEEGPRHSVTITRPFLMAATEVTQGQYEKVMKTVPKAGPVGPNYPVEAMGWWNTREFCKKLSEMPAEKAAGRVYRLPTEAEWEYACRAGTQTPYSFPIAEFVKYAWSGANSGGQTQPVGQLKPNPWGLFDMHGNASEWVLDWYGPGYYKLSPSDDPKGPDSSPKKEFAIRSGTIYNKEFTLRSAARHGHGADWGSTGFRVICELPAIAEAPKTEPPANSKGDIVNLLPLIDPKADTILGSFWQINKAGELVCDERPNNRIRLPYKPPLEYDLRLTVTRQSGGDCLSQFLVGGGPAAPRQFRATIGGGGNVIAAFELVDGKSESDNVTTRKKPGGWLQNGRKFTTLVQVRRDSVKMYLDNQFVTDLNTNQFRNVSMPPLLPIGDETVLGVGAFGSSMIFHQIDVEELSGPGVFTRPDTPAAKKAAADRKIFKSAELLTDIPADMLAENAWGRFGVGSMVKSRVTSLADPSKSDTVDELVKIEKNSLLVERTVPGLNKPVGFLLRPTTVVGVFSEAAKVKSLGRSIKRLREETITIAGQAIRCEVYELVLAAPGATETIEYWISREVPGGICRSINNISIQGNPKARVQIDVIEYKAVPPLPAPRTAETITEIPPEFFASFAWGRFGPGSSLKYKATTSTAAKPFEIVRQLVESGPNEVVVERTGLGPKKTTKMGPRYVFAIEGDIDQFKSQIKSIKRVRQEPMTIAGQIVPCCVYEFAALADGQLSNVEMWSSREVPGAICKSIVNNAQSRIVFEAVEFTAKPPADGAVDLLTGLDLAKRAVVDRKPLPGDVGDLWEWRGVDLRSPCRDWSRVSFPSPRDQNYQFEIRFTPRYAGGSSANVIVAFPVGNKSAAISLRKDEKFVLSTGNDPKRKNLVNTPALPLEIDKHHVLKIAVNVAEMATVSFDFDGKRQATVVTNLDDLAETTWQPTAGRIWVIPWRTVVDIDTATLLFNPPPRP